MRPLPLALALLLVAPSWGATTNPAGGPEAARQAWLVDVEASSFAVLTHRAGAAARLAHNHLVVTRAPRVTLVFDPASPRTARAELTEPVLALEVDPDAECRALAPRLGELGLLTGPLDATAPADRPKVRAAMLEPQQLFAERFPEIRAQLDEIEPRPPVAGERSALAAFTWSGRLRLEVRGETVEKRVPLRWTLVGDTLHAELVARYRFSEFGIEPYSAVLGLVRNADRFDLLVELVARREAAR